MSSRRIALPLFGSPAETQQIILNGERWQRLPADPCAPTALDKLPALEWQAAVEHEARTASAALKQYQAALKRLSRLLAGGLVTVEALTDPGEPE